MMIQPVPSDLPRDDCALPTEPAMFGLIGPFLFLPDNEDSIGLSDSSLRRFSFFIFHLDINIFDFFFMVSHIA